MNGKTILVTGGAGFVGSNLATYFKEVYPEASILTLDNLKRRGSEINIKRLRDRGIEFIHGDIRNREDMNIGQDIDLLLECSAEPSVKEGHGEDSLYVINTNLLGTVNCLEIARKSKADMVFISSSRVYPYEVINALEIVEEPTRFAWKGGQTFEGWSQNGIDVNFPMEGARTLYGASKLCSEILIREYITMYGIRAVINRCGVIAGPWQFGKVDQGVFTHWMLSHYFQNELNYIGFGGQGRQVRDLLHVRDLCKLVDAQIQSLDRANGRTYNVGGGTLVNLSLLETTAICEEITGNRIRIGSDVTTRPGDIAIYVSDIGRVSHDFGWAPEVRSRDILQEIYQWIQENEHDIEASLQ
jgi:CDP-paratose 2-epimerase